MTSNELKGFDYSDLIKKWGSQRVEDALLFIAGSTDHRGLLVVIAATPERAEAILDATYGEYE